MAVGKLYVNCSSVGAWANGADFASGLIASVGQGDYEYPAIDVGNRYSDNGAWSGHNQEFRVISGRANAAWNTGSELRIQFRDGNQLFFGHLTEMNTGLKMMVGENYWFPALAFLGRTTGNIRCMEGLHLHIEGWWQSSIETSS